MKLPPIALAACLALLASPAASGALIAHYVFTDGDLTDNEVGSAYTLGLVTGGDNTITITSKGAASFPGEDAAGQRDYLEVAGPGAAGAFTLSFWFRTGAVGQGSFQGLFSNSTANVANNFSWQVDVNTGTLRFISATSGFPALTNGDPGEPAITVDTWHQVVARKNGNTAELWFGTEGDLQLVGSASLNPGGLQVFRLGVNRNTNSLYAMEMANVRIYNDATVSLPSLNAEGPRVPEGGATLPLLSIALLGLWAGVARRPK